MKKLTLVALLAALSLNACDNSTMAPRCEGENCALMDALDLRRNTMSIINGKRVTDETHSSTVLLFLDYSIYGGLQKSAFCTGTLITPNWVLTAGHCVQHCEEDSDPDQYVEVAYEMGLVRVAITNDVYSVNSQNSFDIKRTIYHPKFTCSPTNIQNDIALIELTESVPLSVAQPTPPMPPVTGITLTSEEIDQAFDAYHQSSSLKMTTVGFGKTKANDDYSSGVKYETTPTPFAYCPRTGTKSQYCGNYLYGTTTDGFIYFTGSPSATCQGDSGGPTFYTRNGIEYVIGVTSFGFGDCNGTDAATLVPDYYVNFIAPNVPNLAADEPEDCTNQVDDNHDGRIDCLDPYCFVLPECIPEDCSNQKDDNSDGRIDCDDPQCATVRICQPEICDNHEDDNDNGLMDCDDPACQGQKICEPEICNNDIDDNEDGKIDCDDPQCEDVIYCQPEDCHNGSDDNLNGLFDCADPQCSESPYCAKEICDNHVDDNLDGLIDCADPQCKKMPVCLKEDCTNQVDDNHDGLIDCDDPKCADHDACQVTELCKLNNSCDEDTEKDDCSATLLAPATSRPTWFLTALALLALIIPRRRKR